MSALMQTYARLPVTFSHGEGVYLYDTDGRRYLDGISGIGVNALNTWLLSKKRDADAMLGSGASSDDGLFFYRNDGAPDAPDHRLVSRDWLPELDLGGTTAPASASPGPV